MNDMTRIERYKKDVKALENIYGSLEGKCISVDLMELAEICPRKYSQKKSFQGLVSYINRTKNATVRITSQITDKNEE